eukprot:6573667-Prymnesium_polylepis.1
MQAVQRPAGNRQRAARGTRGRQVCGDTACARGGRRQAAVGGAAAAQERGRAGVVGRALRLPAKGRGVCTRPRSGGRYQAAQGGAAMSHDLAEALARCGRTATPAVGARMPPPLRARVAACGGACGGRVWWWRVCFAAPRLIGPACASTPAPPPAPRARSRAQCAARDGQGFDGPRAVRPSHAQHHARWRHGGRSRHRRRGRQDAGGAAGAARGRAATTRRF